MVFFASFAVSSRTLRLRAFDRKDRQGFAKFAKKPTRGCRWKRPRLPASQEAIGKETAAGMFPPVCVLSRGRWQWSLVASQNSYDHAASRPKTNDELPTTCLLPTNSAAPSPICGSRSPIAATTSAFTAAPGTRARSTAIWPLPTICAWRACWSNSESRKSASPGESRCCARGWWISSANWPSCAPPMEKNSTSR